jgi:mannose-6-phosphate isomerase
LASLLAAPLPGDGPIGEAWVLSDRDDHPSRVADGPLQGKTIGRLLEQSPEQLLGKLARRFRRFPLLLKFLDARDMLSVQVHPGGETGKTEAWVVLEAGTESRIYAGLKAGTTADDLRRALANGAVADHLVYFTPKPGDSVFIPAGTVHTLGGNVVVFEVQQNNDVTFRLYDWGHVDAKTGQPRALQIDRALWSARGSFNVNISGCGACADSRCLRWAPRVRRACWYASRARDRSSTAAPLMLSEKATYGSCRRSSEPVLFSRAVA